MVLRDNRLDTLKGLLIILVIVGHVIGQVDYGNSGLNWGVRTFIYTFHMPLFILVSGYFTNIKVDKAQFLKGLIKIGVSLAAFQLFSIVLEFIRGGQFPYSLLLIPWWVLWYLLSLIFWRIMMYFTPRKLLKNPFLYLAIAFALSVISGFISHGKILSIQRTLTFYPFFLIGYYFRQGMLKSKPWCNGLSYIIIIAVVVLIIFDFYPDNCRELMSGLGKYSFVEIPAKLYILVLSAITSVSFFNIITEQKPLEIIGKDSLLYYLYHGIVIKFILVPLMDQFDMPQSFAFLLLYSFIIIGFIYIVGKIKLLRWLVSPFNP